MNYKYFRTLALGLSLCTLGLNASAGIQHLLPKPQIAKQQAGTLQFASLNVKGIYLQNEMRQTLSTYGIAVDASSKITLESVLVPSLPKVSHNKNEAYRIVINKSGIRIEAQQPLGLYRGLQTLDQLLASQTKSGALDYCEIIDWPSFRIRGYMQDVGRTYIPLDELKRQIALLARYKVNVFHWHLTENQAWRLESKAFPQLNSAASMTRMAGKYYTLAEARELVEYCQRLRVTLIPEIDMPGHSAAFERAMGFGMQTPEGKAALKVLLREACEAMEVPYIHIGTDEVTFTDPYFVPEMVAYVRSLGKKVISWNPGWEYKLGQIDMTHLWSYRGKAQLGIPAIDSRLHYINHYDLFADLVMLYHSRIYDRPQGHYGLAGTIAAVWNDRLISDPRSIMAQNNVYPAMLALAERSWIGGGEGYFDAPTAALDFSAKDSTRTAFIDFERRMLWHKQRFFRDEAFPYVQQSHAAWYISTVYDNGGDLSRSFAPEASYLADCRAERLAPPAEVGTGDYPYVQGTYGSGAYLRHVWGKTCYSLIAEPQPNSTAYATAWIHSEQAQQAGLLLETQNYSRSESDLAPPQGKWDYKESRVWLNGQELLPPRWTATHSQRDNEQELGNENATARPPMQVSLRKGWNRVLIKLPIDRFSRPEVRLNKWMFAFALTTLDGRDALPGLSYATPRIQAHTPKSID